MGQILGEDYNGPGCDLVTSTLFHSNVVRGHDVIYIYHNLIDATGDKQVSEERLRIMTTRRSACATNMTRSHGRWTADAYHRPRSAYPSNRTTPLKRGPSLPGATR